MAVFTRQNTFRQLGESLPAEGGRAEIDGNQAIIKQLFQEYNIEKPNDMQDALKDLLGGAIKEMMESEMDEQNTWVTANQNALTAKMPAMAINPSK